jgi:hypothetical protein
LNPVFEHRLLDSRRVVLVSFVTTANKTMAGKFAIRLLRLAGTARISKRTPSRSTSDAGIGLDPTGEAYAGVVATEGAHSNRVDNLGCAAASHLATSRDQPRALRLTLSRRIGCTLAAVCAPYRYSSRPVGAHLFGAKP